MSLRQGITHFLGGVPHYQVIYCTSRPPRQDVKCQHQQQQAVNANELHRTYQVALVRFVPKSETPLPCSTPNSTVQV